eukprot:6371648-Amphidinium_carterae.2
MVPSQMPVSYGPTGVSSRVRIERHIACASVLLSSLGKETWKYPTRALPPSWASVVTLQAKPGPSFATRPITLVAGMVQYMGYRKLGSLQDHMRRCNSAGFPKGVRKQKVPGNIIAGCVMAVILHDAACIAALCMHDRGVLRSSKLYMDVLSWTSGDIAIYALGD